MKVDDIFNPRGGTLQVAVRTLLGIHSTTLQLENVLKGTCTVARVFSLNTPHLFFNFLHADFSTENSSNSQISSLSRIGSSHHILCIKHLLSQFRNAQSTELMTTTRSQGGESNHEEVQTGEGDHVDGEFSEIRVELTRETKTSGDTRHYCRDEVVEVSIGRGGEFEGTNANIIQSLIVNTEGLVRVLNELLYIINTMTSEVGDIHEPRGWHCKAQQQYQTPLVMGQRKTLPSFDLGTLHGFC
jgi:hypothetical protein